MSRVTSVSGRKKLDSVLVTRAKKITWCRGSVDRVRG